uniref:Uncharacterized protein n=1 Tax=Lotharella globosa TaxID=91324 RepID=A0A7S3YGZ0_9EUKA
MGCEMSRECSKPEEGKDLSDGKDDLKNQGSQKFEPKARNLEVDQEEQANKKKWRPKTLKVPKQTSPSNRSNQASPSPMHAPQSAEDIQDLIEASKLQQENRHFVQSPHVFPVFDRDEASVGNPLAAPLPDENPVATSDNTGAVDASGAEILKMMQAAEGSYDSFHPQLTRVPQVPKSDQQIGTLHNLHRPAQSSASNLILEPE